MSTFLEARVQRLELEALDQRRTIRQLLGRLADLAQAGRVVQGGFGPGGGGDGGPPPIKIGTASANIAPRSGSTCPAGTLNLVSIDPGTGAVTTGVGTLAVRNPSSSTFSAGVSIKSGQMCAAVKVGDAWLAFPLEC